MPTSKSSHPPEDARWKKIDLALHRLNYRPDALIETLHVAQELFGYLDTDTLAYIAKRLNIPPSKVYGVTTFYNHFNTKPKGRHTLVVCTGTACHVKGNSNVLTWIQKRSNIAPGETTPDNELSLVEVRCVGACALAPIIIADGTLAGKMGYEETTKFIEEWLGDAA